MLKSKRSHGSTAKDLYTSNYFIKMRTCAEATGLPRFIPSAEHGLVSPDEWLEQYERLLPATPPNYRRAWGQEVAAQLEQAVGSLADSLSIFTPVPPMSKQARNRCMRRVLR